MESKLAEPRYQWSEPGTGFIYVLTNSAMPGLRKVGFTKRTINSRIKELESTGVPSSFSVESSYLVPDDFLAAIEKQAHQTLNSSRLRQSREFFKATKDECANAIESAILTITKSEPHNCVAVYLVKRAEIERSKQLAAEKKEKIDTLRAAFIREREIMLEGDEVALGANDAKRELYSGISIVVGLPSLPLMLNSQWTWALVFIAISVPFTIASNMVPSGLQAKRSQIRRIKLEAAAAYPYN